MAHALKNCGGYDIYQPAPAKEFAEEAYLDYGDVQVEEIAAWRERLDGERQGRKLRVIDNGF